jgi:hypothetical protein
MFVPWDGKVRTLGRVGSRVVPAVELATLVHKGSHANIDIAYGSLATYVTRHALAIEGRYVSTIWWGPRTPRMRVPGVLRSDGQSFKRADWGDSMARPP